MTAHYRAKMNIIELAHESGLTVGTNISGVTLVGSPSFPGIAHITIDEMTCFAALVRAQTLEEAAGMCEELDKEARWKEDRLASGRECAAAIRAMKENGND